jgi:hypothetical protein
MKPLARILFLILAILPAGAKAAATTTFEACTDTAGHTVAVVADDTLPRLVASSIEDGKPTIRYNQQLLPRLLPQTRLFFFAHECARHAMGEAGQLAHTVARSREADCLGLATLLEAGLIKRDELPAIQADLDFSEADWTLLPGLPRSFDLAACPARGVVRLPIQALPEHVRTPWNSCVRGCADRLWQCQKACRNESCIEGCMDAARRCEGGCPPVPPVDQSR